MGLVLRAVEVAGPWRWRWLLVDEVSGAALADHVVAVDAGSAEAVAFEDLYRYLRWQADPDRRVASEAELVGRVGAWAGSMALGETVGKAIVEAAAAGPVAVRVQLPAGAESLAFRPWELAHAGGVPLAPRGDVALVYELPGPAAAAKAPVGGALRMLAVFSLPTETSALALRRERYELTRLVRRVAARGRRRVDLRVMQYGVTRAVLADVAEDGGGWDVLHLSGHGGAGELLLEKADGSPDPVPTAELVGLLRPLRARVRLAVVSACQSAAATTAETLRWLGLTDPAEQLEAQASEEAASGASAPVGVARAVGQELGCAVVAMRYPVVDDFAVAFAEAFYDRVFRLAQPVHRALPAAVAAAAGSGPSAGRPAVSVATPALFGATAVGLSLAPPVGPPGPEDLLTPLAAFPAEAERFVGRAAVMAAASAALAPASGRTGVVLHGMAGAGKTAAAVELAYRHARVFEAHAFWAAPTDPDQFGDALRLLAVALETQLADWGLALVDKVATPAALADFLPRLRALLRERGLLLVLDNLETLLTPDGRWRDPRWEPLVAALVGHGGDSRLILTSRVAPGGLDPVAVLVRPVHALSRDESLLLARELPNLGALLHAEAGPVRSAGAVETDRALALRAITLVQGHPKLLELADAAAAEPDRLAARLSAAEAAADQEALGAFLRDGDTTLGAEQFLHTLSVWTAEAAAGLPEAARLLLQALCRIEEPDRTTPVLDGNWANLWARLALPGQPPPLAEAAAPLLAAALVATDPLDPTNPAAGMHYRVHPGVAEAVHVATPDPVTTAVDTELAAWWTSLTWWAIEQERAGQDTSQLVVRAGIAAAPYLLRRHHWTTASVLLERARTRDSYSPATVQAVLPPLRRIAEATGAAAHLAMLAAALQQVDPQEAEALLRNAYAQATDSGDHRIASSTAGSLVNLLRDRGRLDEALALTDQLADHSRRAGLGPWTQLGDQGQRLQILGMLGRHEQVLTDLPALRATMTALPDLPGDNEPVNPWDVRMLILDTGRSSALALGRWQDALDLNAEVLTVMRGRGASVHETAYARFNDHGPLRRLGHVGEADQLLRDCQQVFETAGDIGQLAQVFDARATLEAHRGHWPDAVALGRTALRLGYVQPNPRNIAGYHHNLANHLAKLSGHEEKQHAHRLAAALLSHLTGMTHDLASTLQALAADLRRAPTPPPATLAEVTALVEAGDGIHLANLLATLSPDPAATDHALRELLTAAASFPAAAATERHLADWEPVIAAVVVAVTTGHTPPALRAELDQHAARPDWAALVAALRRVLDRERDRDQLLAGLDDIDTAILTATLDRIAEPGQDR